MKIILFGASGMIGQGVLRQCLADPTVTQILSIGRSAPAMTDSKLTALVHDNFFDYSTISNTLRGYDACLFCLGVSAGGMSEEKYHRLTYELTLAAAHALLGQNPQLTFIYVSGTGTNSSEKGGAMWARVKGKTENALLRLPFKDAYMFRPAYIHPVHGEVARAPGTRWMYTLVGPLYPLWRALLPRYVTTTEVLAKAMITAARRGAPKKIIENEDLAALADAQ